MPCTQTVAEIAVPLPVYRLYSYSVPCELSPSTVVGRRVLVPFGRRRVTGYVLNISTSTACSELKSVLDVLDEGPLFPESMVPLFQWMASYYLHPIGRVIKNALPAGFGHVEQRAFFITAAGQKALVARIMTPLEQAILQQLRLDGMSMKALGKRLGQDIPQAVMRGMQRTGWIRRGVLLKTNRTLPKTERHVSAFPAALVPSTLSDTHKKILALLKSHDGPIPLRQLKRQVPSASRRIQSLKDARLIDVFDKRTYRDPLGNIVFEDHRPHLTREQQQAVDTIAQQLGGGFGTWVLAGVTGSGKTEVYLQLTAMAMQKGGTVIILAPEIALISQLEGRFRARFKDRIAVLHSGLSAGERLDQWQKIVNGDVQIALGARSAVFAPFAAPGLIIVDEEHDTAYKQDAALRYNARDLAVVRARQHGALAVLGSATPSIQTSYNVRRHKFHQVMLKTRIEKRPLPEIQVVDLRSSRPAKESRYLSDALLSAMRQTLARNEQVILFLNRRGFANFPICRDCGTPLSCRHCDVALTFHREENLYRCHYCGYSAAAGMCCSACQSPSVQHLGMGTEKIESVVRQLFPDKSIVRMDADTMARKGALLCVLKKLHNGAVDILVGTQMVAKGHDFPNITLVGVVCADLSLGFPDFRAGERTFQLLAQVAGRAGRGQTPGRVILQTYNPEHFSIRCAREQDFTAFYEKEIQFRRSLAYPPFSRMVQLVVSSRDRTKGAAWIQQIRDRSRRLKQGPAGDGITVLGPIQAPLAKIADRHRWQVLLMGKHADRLHRFIRTLLFEKPSLMHHPAVTVSIDVDPVFMM